MNSLMHKICHRPFPSTILQSLISRRGFQTEKRMTDIFWDLSRVVVIIVIGCPRRQRASHFMPRLLYFSTFKAINTLYSICHLFNAKTSMANHPSNLNHPE